MPSQIAPPSSFLPLAPSTSDSYPIAPSLRSNSVTSTNSTSEEKTTMAQVQAQAQVQAIQTQAVRASTSLAQVQVPAQAVSVSGNLDDVCSYCGRGGTVGVGVNEMAIVDGNLGVAVGNLVTESELTQSTEEFVKRRSSSTISSESAASLSGNARVGGVRFLKLGPAHWGENLDGSRGDWAEMQ